MKIHNQGPTLAIQLRNAVVIVILLFVIVGIYAHDCGAR